MLRGALCVECVYLIYCNLVQPRNTTPALLEQAHTTHTAHTHTAQHSTDTRRGSPQAARVPWQAKRSTNIYRGRFHRDDVRCDIRERFQDSD